MADMNTTGARVRASMWQFFMWGFMETKCRDGAGIALITDDEVEIGTDTATEFITGAITFFRVGFRVVTIIRMSFGTSFRIFTNLILELWGIGRGFDTS